MGKDVKIGLALGLVVIVVAIVVFSVGGGGDPARRTEDGAEARTDVGPPAAGAPEVEQRPGPGPVVETPFEAIIDPGRLFGPGRIEGDAPPAGEVTPPGRADAGGDRPGRTLLVERAAEPLTRTVEHIVAAGDSLWALARRYYGDARRLAEIHQANRARLATPNAPLTIGMKLTIPNVPVEAAPARVAETPEAAGPSPAGPSGGEAGFDDYVVRPGDTLALIARRFYGSDRMIQPIVQANPRLAGNPNHIVVGWTLRIPKVAGVERTARAGDID